MEILCNLGIDLMFDVCHVSSGEFRHRPQVEAIPWQLPVRAGPLGTAACARARCTPAARAGKTSETPNLKVIWDVYVGAVR